MEEKGELQTLPVGGTDTLTDIIRDFTFILSRQQEMGLTRLDLPPDAVSLMDGWLRGRFRPLPAASETAKKSASASPVSPRATGAVPAGSLAGAESSVAPPPPSSSSSSAAGAKKTAATPQAGTGVEKNRVTSKATSLRSAEKSASPEAKAYIPAVHIQGPENAKIVFMARADMVDEQNRPDMTTGPAGELLLNILKAMHLNRDQVCMISFQPPGPAENIPDAKWTKAVKTLVFEKMKTLQPRIICTMGETACRVMLGETVSFAKGQGRFHNMASALLMPTLHPRELIKDPALKRPVWESMKQIMKREGL